MGKLVEMVSQRYSREIRNQGLGFRLEGAPTESVGTYGPTKSVGTYGRRSARFSHHGGNMGYRCFIVAYRDREAGQGAVVMINSDNGSELIQEIVRSIAWEYGWPDYPTDGPEWLKKENLGYSFQCRVLHS